MNIKDLPEGNIAVVTKDNPNTNIIGRCIYKLNNTVYYVTGNDHDIILPMNETWSYINIKQLGQIEVSGASLCG